jgi:hypothetical protein
MFLLPLASRAWTPGPPVTHRSSSRGFAPGQPPAYSTALENSPQVGLAERVMGAAQAAWPLAVVLSCYLPVRALAPAREVNQASNA